MCVPLQYRSGFSPVEEIVLEGEITPNSADESGDSSSGSPPAPEMVLDTDTLKPAAGAIPAGSIVAS